MNRRSILFAFTAILLAAAAGLYAVGWKLSRPVQATIGAAPSSLEAEAVAFSSTDGVSGLAHSGSPRPDSYRPRCYTDVRSTDELLAEALRLTRADRARVTEELLSSLEESDEEVASAWADELERRSRESAEGRVQSISWETARTEILKELEQRRATRTAS